MPLQSYGLQVFNESLHNELLHNWTRPHGCKEQISACQDELKGHGPIFINKATANFSHVCRDISPECQDMPAFRLYQEVEPGAGWYDIAHPKYDPFPPPHMNGYLTQESVLGALGVPVNFSSSSGAVGEGFSGTFDIIHGGFLDSMAYLLDSGVKIHMMYGDRDYPCNWIGGEAASLAVPYSRADDFAEAGYAPLITPDGISGLTRQFGNFSFTRVFQAGHEVPSYQPAAAHEIFKRATFGLDISTGLVKTKDDFATIGPKDVWHVKHVPPIPPKPKCYVLKPGACVPEMWKKVVAGSVVVKDWFVVEDGDSEDGETRHGLDPGQKHVEDEL